MSAKPTALGGSKPLLAGGALGIPLASGQEIVGYYDITSGSASIIAPATCTALLYLWGAPGGGSSGGGGNPGGAGSSALFKKFSLSVGQAVQYVLGAPGIINGNGALTTVTLPDGSLLTVPGGTAGASGATSPGGVPGVPTGGDINRLGGQGGPTVGGVAANGSPGDHGSLGGIGQNTVASKAGGGGSAGFSEIPSSLAGAPGANDDSSASGAGGGGFASPGVGVGGLPRLLLILVRAA